MKLLSLTVFLFTIHLLNAQIGIGTTSPAPSSLLDVESNSKGILIPRMIEGDKNAIDDPDNGLLIYQTDETPGFYYYDNVSSAWSLLANKLESDKGFNTDVILNGTDLEVTDGKGEIIADLSSLKELPTPIASGTMNYWDGAAWVEVAPTLSEGAELQMISGVPTWTGGTPPLPAIGDIRDGGLVFWIDPSDPDKGKVCALDNSGFLSWSDAVSQCDNYINPDTGTGVYADWYLPSKDELQLMYANLLRFGCSTNTPGGLDDPVNDPCSTSKGGFGNYYLWSSDEYDIDNAYIQSFYDGHKTTYLKTVVYTNQARAVRAF
jgi:hypothetical protein